MNCRSSIGTSFVEGSLWQDLQGVLSGYPAEDSAVENAYLSRCLPFRSKAQLEPCFNAGEVLETQNPTNLSQTFEHSTCMTGGVCLGSWEECFKNVQILFNTLEGAGSK